MNVKPKKKLYITLWVIMGFLFVFILWLAFNFLLGPYRVFSGIGLVLAFSMLIFIYIKSVLNFFEIKVEGDRILVLQFGKLVAASKIKEIRFHSDETKSGSKKYQRIVFESQGCKVVVSNFEHDGFEVFNQFLFKSKRLITK